MAKRKPVPEVHQLRKSLGVSQQAFAMLLDLSMRAIANYEGDRRPAASVLMALADLAEKFERIDLAVAFLTHVEYDLRSTKSLLWVRDIVVEAIVGRRQRLIDKRGVNG